MLNPQDIVKKEFDQLQAEQKWYNQEWFLGKAFWGLSNLVTWVKHLFSPKSKEIDTQRDWNEANFRAKQKLQADIIRQEAEFARQQYNQEQKEIETLEQETQKLSNLPEYSDMFVRTKKLLADKKQSFADKQALYFDRMGKYNEVSDSADIIKLSRWPLSSSFINKENANKFLTTVMSQPTEWVNEQELMKNRIEKTALQNIFKQYDPIVNDMIREWMIRTPDEFYTSQDFMSMAKQAVSAVATPLQKNFTKVLDESGEVDWEKLLAEIQNNSQSAQAMELFERKIKKDKQDVRDMKWVKSQELWLWWRLYGDVVAWKKIILDYLNEGFDAYNNPDKTVKFFGDKEIKNYIYGSTDTNFGLDDVKFSTESAKKLGRYLQTNIVSNPADTALLIADMATAFMSGRWLLRGSKLANFDKWIDALNMWARSQIGWVLANAFKTVVKKVPRIADEVVFSLPINSTIDAMTAEYDTFGMNTAMDGVVGMWAKVAPDWLKWKIISEITNFADGALKEKAFKWYFGAVPEGLNLSDVKQVEDFVDSQVKIRTNKWDTFTVAKDIIRQQVNDAPNDFGYDFFANYFKRVVPTTDEIFWTNTNKYFADNIQRANKVIDDTTIDVVQKTDLLRSEFKRIIDVSMTDKALENLTNYKLAQYFWGNAYNSAVKVLQETGGLSSDSAKSMAFEMLPHLSSEKIAQWGAFQKLFSEFGDMDKTQRVVDELSKKTVPMMIAKGNPKMTMKDLDDMLTPDSIPENKAFKTIGNRTTLEKDWYTFVITKEPVWTKGQRYILEALDSNGEAIARSNHRTMASAQKAVTDVIKPKKARDVWWFRQQLVEQIELDTGGKLNTSTWDFISRLPTSSAEDISEWFLEFYKAIGKKWEEKVMRAWLGKVIDAVNNTVYLPESYSAYKLFDTSDEAITRVFGEEFMNYVNVNHKGVIDADVLWKLHTQYLTESFLLQPDNLQAYMAGILKNTDLDDGQKALLLAQVKEMDRVVIEPIGDFIRGIMSYKGMTDSEIDKVLSITKVEKVKSGILSKVGKQVDETKIDFDLMFDWDIANSLSKFNNEYVEALANGISAKGSPNYVPPFRDVAYGIKNAIENWTAYDIPASYMNATGMRVLNDLFTEGGKVYDWYTKFVEEAFKRKQKQFVSLWHNLVNQFYDMDTGILKTMTDIDWQAVSLFDVMNIIDSRISETVIGNSWWVVFSMGLDMTKYQLMTDKTGFNDTRSKFLKWYINNKYKDNVIKEWQLDDFLTKTDGTDVVSSYMKLIGDVEDEFAMRVVREGKDFTEDQLTDLLHPLYYSFDEYLIGIAKWQPTDVVKSILSVISERALKNWTLPEDIAKLMIDEDMSKWFLNISKWQAIKNYNVSELAESWNDFIKLDTGDIKISRDYFNDFLYKNIWYFLARPVAWVFDNDALSMFGWKIVQLAKQRLDEKSIVQLNTLLDNVYTAAKEQNTKQIDELEVQIRKVLKKTEVPEDDLKLYFEYIRGLDNAKASEHLMPNTIKFIQDNATKFEVPTTPVDIIDNAVKLAEDRAQFKLHFLQTQQARREEIIRQQVFEQINKWAEMTGVNKKWQATYNEAGGKALDDMLNALGMDKKNARQALEAGGFSDETIKELLSNTKKPVNDEQAIKAITDMIVNDQVSAWYLLKNQAFQRIFNGVQERILNSRTSKELRAINPKTWKPDTRIIVDIINQDGKINKKINESYGGLVDNILKSVANLSTKWLYDQEWQGIQERYIKRTQDWNVFKPSILIDWKQRPVIWIKWYLRAVQDELTNLNVRHDYSLEEIKRTATDAFGDAKVFGIYKEQDRLDELYKFLKWYKDDISRYRGKFTELGLDTSKEWIADKGMLLENFNSMSDFTNRLTGTWVNMSNIDVKRIAERFGMDTPSWWGIFSKLFHAINKDFRRDIFYGGLYDEAKRSTLSNMITSLYIWSNYNILTRPFPWVQQLWNNKTYAKSLFQATGMPSNANIDWLVDLKTTNDILWFDLLKGRIDDVTHWPIKRVRWKFLHWTQEMSSLYQSDKLAYSSAVRSSLAQAFAPIYDAGGEQAVKLVNNKMRNFEDFLTKYGMDFKLFDNKFRAIEHIKLKASELGTSVDEALVEYHKHRTVYFNEFAPLYSKARSALSAFYATDNIREFASIRLVDASLLSKHVFALKKWSLAKAGEYVYRVVQETDWTLMWLAKNIVSWKSDALREMAIQMSEYIRAWWMFERASDWDYDAEDLMLQMAIPTVVFSMALFDAINKWGKSWADMWEATDNLAYWMLDGAIEIVNSFMGTAFIYHKWFFESIQRWVTTANQYSWDSWHSPFLKWVEAFLNHVILWWLSKWQVDRYRGIEMRSWLGGNDVSRTLGWLTNTTSSVKKEQDRLVDNLYKAGAVARGYGISEALQQGARDNALLSFFGKMAGMEFMKDGMQFVDLWIIGNDMRGWLKTKNMDLLFKKYIDDKDKFNSMVDNISEVRMVDRIANKMWWTQWELFIQRWQEGNVGEEEFMKLAKENGIIPELPIWTYIEQQLAFTSWVGKSIRDIQYEPLIDTKVTDRLANEFVEFVTNNKIKLTNDQWAILKFINAQTQLGSNYAMSEYMKAYSNWVWKLMQEEYGLKDVKFWFEEGIDRIQAYTDIWEVSPQFVTAVADYQNILKDSLYTMRPDVVGENPYIWLDIQNKYISLASDSPIKWKNTGFAEHLFIEKTAELLERDGAVSDEVMNVFTIHAGKVINRLKSSQTGSPEDKEKAITHLLRVANRTLWVLDERDMSNVAKASMKMWLAYVYSPLADSITEANKAEFDSLMETLKPELQMFVDSLTGSSPLDTKTALEYATNKDLSWGDGKWWKKWTNAKPKKRHDKELQLASTKIKNLAWKIPWYKYAGTNWWWTPWYKPTSWTPPLREFDIDFWDLTIKVPELWKLWWPEWWTGKTQRLKITKRSSANIPSKKRSPLKIKSFRI